MLRDSPNVFRCFKGTQEKVLPWRGELLARKEKYEGLYSLLLQVGFIAASTKPRGSVNEELRAVFVS
ncbi:unnamed protein product [Microthlaspi erraticum]|uniref:Uncharacterized protein n=1 Tax=Microthlaspi erraticum TaxID=1685480 RepID=A0A6D2KQW9_9BRAS|nr:unnamed protein product [Microthlaspi erraticum]